MIHIHAVDDYYIAHQEMRYEAWCQDDDVKQQHNHDECCARCGTLLKARWTGYCSDACFYADNHPFIKNNLIVPLIESGNDYEAIISAPQVRNMFSCCSDPTVKRWKRAIERRCHERDMILDRAKEIENFNNQEY